MIARAGIRTIVVGAAAGAAILASPGSLAQSNTSGCQHLGGQVQCPNNPNTNMPLPPGSGSQSFASQNGVQGTFWLTPGGLVQFIPQTSFSPFVPIIPGPIVPSPPVIGGGPSSPSPGAGGGTIVVLPPSGPPTTGFGLLTLTRPAGGTGFKITENESPRPADRVFVGYDYFNTPGTLPDPTNPFLGGQDFFGGTPRWGDYSAVTPDPTDDVTLWWQRDSFDERFGQERTNFYFNPNMFGGGGSTLPDFSPQGGTPPPFPFPGEVPPGSPFPFGVPVPGLSGPDFQGTNFTGWDVPTNSSALDLGLPPGANGGGSIPLTLPGWVADFPPTFGFDNPPGPGPSPSDGTPPPVGGPAAASAADSPDALLQRAAADAVRRLNSPDPAAAKQAAENLKYASPELRQAIDQIQKGGKVASAVATSDAANNLNGGNRGVFVTPTRP